VINKANANVTVNGYTGTYNGAAHGATGSASGVGGVDLSAGLSLGASFTAVPGGTAHWTFVGGENYNDASGDAVVILNPLSIIGGFTAGNKVYDGTASATILTRSLSGVLTSDVPNVSLSGGSANFTDANVANGKQVVLTGASLSGSASGNYALTSVATTTADITALGITGSFTAQNKIYDGNTSATVGTRSLSGVLGADLAEVSLSGGTATFADKNVGAGKMVTLTGASLSGSASGNYSLISVATTSANITAKNLTINGAVAADKVFDGNTTATVSFAAASLAGVETADIGTVMINSAGYSATFADSLVGSAKPVTVIGVALGGAGAANYSVSQPAGLTASISAWTWTGFFQPVDNAPVINRVNSGSAIPVKFSLGDKKDIAVFAPNYPQSVPFTVNGENIIVSQIQPIETVTANGSSLTYDAGSKQYIYVWKTEKSWAGSYRQLVLRLADGSVRVANFNFSK
jgi:trimeric autotransporter adhesin